MKSRNRTNPLIRQQELLTLALKLAEEVGYQNITCLQLAKKAGVCRSLIFHYLGSMPKLKKNIMQFAVEHEILNIIAQGLAVNDPVVSNLSDELKKRAVKYLINK